MRFLLLRISPLIPSNAGKGFKKTLKFFNFFGLPLPAAVKLSTNKGRELV